MLSIVKVGKFVGVVPPIVCGTVPVITTCTLLVVVNASGVHLLFTIFHARWSDPLPAMFACESIRVTHVLRTPALIITSASTLICASAVNAANKNAASVAIFLVLIASISVIMLDFNHILYS